MPARQPPGAVARAMWTGAFAGFAAGVADALISWRALGRFLPGPLDRLRAALHAGALYAAVLAIVAAAAGALGALLFRHTALRKARRPPGALLIAAVPSLAAGLLIAYQVGLVTIQRRHHHGLIVAVVIAATLAALAGAALATLLLGRLLEIALPPRARHPLVAAALLLLAGGAVAFAARRTLVLLPLRPWFAALGWLVLCIPAARLATRALARLSPRARAFSHPAIVAGPLCVALALGSSPAVRKGAGALTGLTVPLSVIVQHVFDLDRDGYSSVLGGGDCNDLDPSIHPGAFDIPGDGIDQNCLGGDLTTTRVKHDTAFVPVPDTVPRDANILLLTIDALRADHLGAYGYRRPTSPALDALARRGELFVNGWAHAPSTRYSVPAILTGRYPSQISWDNRVWWPALAPDNVTVAETLKARGFFTGAILCYGYFDRIRHMDQGFDFYDNSNARLHVGRDPASTRGSSSRQQADAAIRFLNAHAAQRFFLWVHFYDPHADYEPHPDTVSFGTDNVALYDGEIRFTDDQIGRVLARLHELGIDGKTIIAVTGDHGEGFGEHGIDHHGYHLYLAQTKVPFIIYVPGLPPRRIETPAGHVDLLPTFANLTGAPSSPRMSGRSLLGPMLGKEDLDRAIYQEVSYEGPTERRALVTRTKHLIYNMIPGGTFELYDLVKDPTESHDVWGRDPESDALAERLAKIMDENLAALDGEDALLSTPPRPEVPVHGDFGGAVRFLGADLPRDARPGSVLDVTWYFESEKQLAGAWRPFVHIEGPRRFLGDHDPVGGALPIARWRPGQIIADCQKLQVPAGLPAGDYVVYLGIYQGGARLPLAHAGDADAGQNRLRVATIQVRP